MRKFSLLGFGTAVLVAGALMFSFTLTPVDAAAHKFKVCHNSPGGEDGIFSVVIAVGSVNSVEKHLANHAGDFEDPPQAVGEEFTAANCPVV